MAAAAAAGPAFRLSAPEVASRIGGAAVGGPVVAYPLYNRKGGKHGIVHIGPGSFHRAHLAVYMDALLEHGGEAARDWFICGVGLQPGDKGMLDALAPQDFLYTVLERSQHGERAQVVGALTDLLYAPGNEQAVIAKMASPHTHIVSLTITESGYNRVEATGELDESHPTIVADLSAPSLTAPKSVYGFLTAALDQRHAAGLKPFTVLSCDNVQGNGDMVRRMLLTFVRRRNAALAAWLEKEGAFPNSMVDRIAPRTTPEVVDTVKRKFGIVDAWPVVCEPFKQWVLEDHFCDGRPPFEVVGAQLVKNVVWYENIKLRVLNASHSACCYLGALAGHEYVHNVVQTPLFHSYLERMLAYEVEPLLHAPDDVDLNKYSLSVLTRFSNPALGDQVARICFDGSGKLPKFLLPSIKAQLGQTQPNISLLCLAVASWLRYLGGKDEKGNEYKIDDPLVAILKPAGVESLAAKSPVPLLRVLAEHAVFDKDLLAHPRVVELLTAHYTSLVQHGAVKTLENAISKQLPSRL